MVCIKYKHTTDIYSWVPILEAPPILGAPLQFVVFLVPSKKVSGLIGTPFLSASCCKATWHQEIPQRMRTKYQRIC